MSSLSSVSGSLSSAAPVAARRSRLLLAGVLSVLLVGGGVWWMSRKEEAASSAETARGGRGGVLTVSGLVLKARPFTEIITASGTLRAAEAIELQTEVNGKIVSLNFQEGQRVVEGQILVKIDDSTQQASLRRSQARRALATLREQRLARLVEEGGVSQLEFDEAQGELAVIDAEIEVLRADIAKTEIRAPFDGVAGLRFVSVGAYVNPTVRIATLQRLSSMKVDFSVPERYAPFVNPGTPVGFTVAGSSNRYVGEVVAVEPRVEIATRSILLRAVCSNPDLKLIPGLFARMELPISQSEAALLVPAISVLVGLEERFVFVARDGKAERVQVRTGARTANEVQIVEGLAPGDVVLTSGVQQLRNGLPVQVVFPAS
jgi:membrane fusion protein (multidrug efflux system)